LADIADDIKNLTVMPVCSLHKIARYRKWTKPTCAY